MKYIDKTVLVTGASSGIGKEFVHQFHNLGANVILVARRKELIEEIANNLNDEREYSARFITCDLTKEKDISNLETFLKEETIDILINNAGRGSFGCFEKLDIDDEVNQVCLNINSNIKLAHIVIPQMKERKSGAIVNLSSIAAFQPLPFMATYAGTKAFNFFHSLALREELKSFGIKVLALCPGPTATEFGGVARVPGTISGITRERAEDVVSQAIRALEKGKSYIVTTGLKSKTMAFLSWFLPKRLSTAFLGRGLKKVLDKNL